MGNANMSRNFEYNTYWYNGSQSNDKYDTNTLDTDPGFINAVNGDFTVTGASQLEKRTGDPRWLPLVEETKFSSKIMSFLMTAPLACSAEQTF